MKASFIVTTCRPERMMLLTEYKRRREEALERDQRRQTEVRDVVQLLVWKTYLQWDPLKGWSQQVG